MPPAELTLFLSSPGDVAPERAAARRVVEELNASPAWSRRCRLRLLAWEEEVPAELGDAPQRLVDRHMGLAADADLFVCVLCHRLGSPVRDETGREYPSGTLYELASAYDARQRRGRPIMLLYRGLRPLPPRASRDQREQYNRVCELFEDLQGGRGPFQGLPAEYEDVSEFEARLRLDLQKHLDHLLGPAPADARPPGPDTGEFLRPYLAWLAEQLRWLPLHGVPEAAAAARRLELEHVYVALRAEPGGDAEQAGGQQLHAEERAALIRRLSLARLALEQLARLDTLVLRATYRPALDQARREQAGGAHDLARVFARHRKLVLLGGPGSGKSTLVRWLALHLARARLAHAGPGVPARVVVRAGDHASGASFRAAAVAQPPTQTEVDLGPALLPILVRVADYAREAARVDREERRALPLAEYLGRQPWGRELPSVDGRPLPADALRELFQDTLRRGEALVLLDGLDEVTEHNRQTVVAQLETFVRVWVDGRGRSGADGAEDGNRVVVTSRPAGYRLAPLRVGAAHHVLEPLDRDGAGRLARAWMAAAGRADEADRFLAALFDDARPRLRELAVNPLLLTVLAAVHLHDGRLPDGRAPLYDRAVRNLLRAWLDRDALREVGLTEADLFAALEPLAARLHDEVGGNGLVPLDELREVAGDGLARARGVSPDDPAFARVVGGLVDAVRDQVGLLGEVAPGAYAFLHRTFQEYLAARHLLRDRPRAGTALAARLLDPVGREPVVLALGHALTSPEWGPRARGQLLDDFLAGDAAGPGPRASLLLAGAAGELQGLPPAVAEEVAGRLLAAHAERWQDPALAPLVEEVEGALGTLYRSEHRERVEAVLARGLRGRVTGPPGLPAATAALLVRLGVFTPALAEALLDAVPADRADRGWPVDRALRAALCRRGEDDLPAPFTPGGALLYRLPLRRALAADPALAAAVAADPDWLALVVALYGGLEGDGTGARWQEARQRWREETLGRDPDADRGPFDRLARARKAGVSFDPGHVYRDPGDGITAEVLALLRAGRPAADLRPALRRRWEAGGPAAGEALVALAALGDDVVALLRPVPDDPGRAALALELFGRLQGALADALVRLGGPARPWPPADLPTDLRVDLDRAVTATLVGAGAGPVRPGRPRPELVPLAPDDPEARADADAEYWAHLLTGTLELNPFQLATVLRYHGDRLGEPARLLSALSRAHAAVNRGGPAQLAWGVPPLPLPPADDRDRFLLALDALGAVPAAFDSFAEWAVGCMTPWVRGHADLVPETLALDLARHGGYLSMDGEYLRYYGEDPADLSAGAVIPLAAGLSDPYLRARAFARLLAVPDGAVRARALEEATAAVALVADPARAADACERLLPHLAGEVRSDLLRRAVAAAGTAEPEVRARLLARLVAHVPPAEAAALCTRALTAAAEVLDERRRAALLAALRPVLPRETARLDELAAGLADGWERGRAEGRSSRWLGRQRAGWDPGPAGWAAVYLAAVAAEVGRLRPGPGHDGLWAALGGPEQAAALAALREAADQGGLTLTAVAVSALERALDRGDDEPLRRLLPGLGRAEPAALAVVAGWRSRAGLPGLAAALWLAEAGRLDADALPRLIELLAEADDRLRFRAGTALCGPPEARRGRRWSVRLVGPEVLEEVHRQRRRVERHWPAARTILSWVTDAVTHDSPEAVADWLARAAGDGPDAEVARAVLEKLEAPTLPVFRALLRGLEGPAAVQELVLRTLARLASRHTLTEDAWAGARAAVLAVPAEVRSAVAELPDGPADVLAVAVAIVHDRVPEDARLDEAERRLDARRISALGPGPDNPNEWRTWLGRLFQGQWFNPERLRGPAPLAAEDCPDEAALVPLLTEWGAWTVSRRRGSERVDDVLLALAAVAGRSPAAFAVAAGEEADTWLAEVVEAHRFWPARVAAVRLLGLLRRVTRPALEALRVAMRDVGAVRQAVRDAVPHFRHVEPELLGELLAGLTDASPGFAHVVAGVLAALARAEGTVPARRRQILDGLLAAARDPANRRPVHEVRDEWADLRTHPLGRLDALLLRTACELTRW